MVSPSVAESSTNQFSVTRSGTYFPRKTIASSSGQILGAGRNSCHWSFICNLIELDWVKFECMFSEMSIFQGMSLKLSCQGSSCSISVILAGEGIQNRLLLQNDLLVETPGFLLAQE